jgi:hypothetical protein
VTVAAGIGATAAIAYRDGPQIVSERPGSIEVTFGPPIEETFMGRGTCLTVANDDAIARVQGEPFISVDGTDWSVSLVIEQGEFPQHRVGILPVDDTERMARYLSGVVADVDVETSGDRTAGSATFSDLRPDPGKLPIMGHGGPERLDGEMTWSCDEG